MGDRPPKAEDLLRRLVGGGMDRMWKRMSSSVGGVRFGSGRIVSGLSSFLDEWRCRHLGPGGLLANPSRARVLLVLADGRALPAIMLAAEAGVSASTASEHLVKLADGGMLAVERRARHRYYRIASPRVSAAVEALAQIAPSAPARSLRQHHSRACRRGRGDCATTTSPAAWELR